MSKETWLAEFYPIPAFACPKEEAIEHSLRKWIGLRDENTSKHQVFANGSGTYLRERHERLAVDPVVMSIGSQTCALCAHYLKGADCRRCPLSRARGGVPCDKDAAGERYSPWAQWVRQGDPEPMIHWLTVAKERASQT